MNKIYAMTMLYAYPKLSKIAKQIDEIIKKIALTSMENFSPCVEQCEKIVAYTVQKEKILSIKEMVEKALAVLSEKQKDILDYKYFRLKPKRYHEQFDRTSRAYFRQQIAVLNKVSERFEKKGITNEFFEKECLRMRFFSTLMGRVVEHEKNCRKNKSKKEKLEKIKQAETLIQKEAKSA